MIKAGSLTYAIFLSVITAILCSLMITLAYMNRSFFIRVNWRDVARDNAYSGIAWGMALESKEDHRGWKDLYEEGDDSVWVKKRKWGAYEVIASRAVKKGSSYEKTAVIAYENKGLDEWALWLADHNRPLQLTGNALLKGKCFLPEKGVDRAYVEGTNYKRERLVYGTEEQSRETIEKPRKEIREYWESYLKGTFRETDSVVDFGALPENLVHSFFKPTLMARSEKAITLHNRTLKGNIIVYSAQSIDLSDSSAVCEDLVLIAPVVRIKKGFKGSLQVIAADSVILDKDVELQYPSSIITLALAPDPPCVQMNAGSCFRGTVLSYWEGMNRTNDLAVEINDSARVYGLVYCEGNLELGGEVFGSVICNNFLLSTRSGIYENHILNGRIDRSELTKNFASVPFENLKNQPIPVVWLPY